LKVEYLAVSVNAGKGERLAQSPVLDSLSTEWKLEGRNAASAILKGTPAAFSPGGGTKKSPR